MSKVNKTQLIKQYLIDHGSITSWEAIEKFGATRLAAIIFELRKHYDIATTMVEAIDRYGNWTTYAQYDFIGEL